VPHTCMPSSASSSLPGLRSSTGRRFTGNATRYPAVFLSAQRLFAEALARGISQSYDVEALAHGSVSEEVTEACARERGATLVYDGSSDDQLELVPAVSRALGVTRVVVCGLADDHGTLRVCARLQIGGLVARDASLADLAEAIRTVAVGGRYTSSSLIPILLELAAVAPRPGVEDVSRLTERERQVAALLARGLTYAQVASELVVSPATVKNHAHNINKKKRFSGRFGVPCLPLATRDRPHRPTV
jgi:DNA-binding NarL/FixJ family response regulator